MTVFLSGLVLGLSLIMALGPQNIFLIRQSALRQHPITSMLTCFVADSLLLAGSVIGLQTILQSHPALKLWLALFGAIFLLHYGIRLLLNALRFKKIAAIEGNGRGNRGQIILIGLSVSLLNPPAIIDSLVLIGGGSSQYPGAEHFFLFGAICSSLIWFSLLSFSAYHFSAILVRSHVWRSIELFSGLLMVYLSVNLVLGQI